jgi:ABC-type uncharacterized transport system substrate-binding protein
MQLDCIRTLSRRASGGLSAALATAALALALLLPASVSAHPHARFTYQLEPILSADAITGLRVRWQLDPISSLMVLRGIDFNRNGVTDPEELAAFARQNDALVAAAGYFLTLGDAEQALTFSVTQGLSALVLGQRIHLEFEVALPAPRPGALTVRLFDPTWYVALSPDEPAVPPGHACTGTTEAQVLETQGWGTQTIPVVRLRCGGA